MLYNLEEYRIPSWTCLTFTKEGETDVSYLKTRSTDDEVIITLSCNVMVSPDGSCIIQIPYAKDHVIQSMDRIVQAASMHKLIEHVNLPHQFGVQYFTDGAYYAARFVADDPLNLNVTSEVLHSNVTLYMRCSMSPLSDTLLDWSCSSTPF